MLKIKYEGKVRTIKNDIVFTSQVGIKIGRLNLVRAFAKALERAEIKGFTYHCIRHIFGTRLAQNGEFDLRPVLICLLDNYLTVEEYWSECGVVKKEMP